MSTTATCTVARLSRITTTSVPSSRRLSTSATLDSFQPIEDILVGRAAIRVSASSSTVSRAVRSASVTFAFAASNCSTSG